MRFDDVLLISAPVDVVWGLTLDVESWPSITPTMTSVERLDEGPLAVGSRVRIVQPRQPPSVWTVTRLETDEVFEWETRVLGVRMVASHRLEPVQGGTRNTLVLDLDGRGAGLLARFAGRALRRALHTENAGFARRAEEVVDGLAT